MSDSVFDYEKRRRPQDRARAYKLESNWRCSNSTIDGATFETRKSEAIAEISRRIKMFMGQKLLDKMQHISVVMNCEVLHETVGDYEIALHCYVQCATQICRSILQLKFGLEDFVTLRVVLFAALFAMNSALSEARIDTILKQRFTNNVKKRSNVFSTSLKCLEWWFELQT